MCGINGFNFSDSEALEKMNQITAHRGPDQNATYTSPDISLGFNRLAIIDLSERASQPMWDAHHEVAIIFNGEIYNYQDLRSTLKSKYSFKSESDTEVILNGYLEYGQKIFEKLNGMFALAIWDSRANELIVARDRIGIKPLYYFWDKNKLIFSSEIKAILEHRVPREVDQTAFNLYFSLLYIPSPYTMFRGIKKLPPATYLTLKNNQLSFHKFWSVKAEPNQKSYAETRDEIKILFDDAVKRQLVSDRPVGVYLSGGLDSTAVLGSVIKAGMSTPKTFSVGFDIADPKFNHDFLLARETAKLNNTDHHEVMLKAKDVSDNLEKIAWHLDEPNFNPTAVAMYELARVTKPSATVVLGGDGADELFGGYPRYYYSRLISYLATVPLAQSVGGMFNRKLGLKTGPARVASFLALPHSTAQTVINPDQFINNTTIKYLSEHYFSGNKFNDFENEFMNIDRQSWLVDESLMRTDRMTMAWGVEERVPILDYRLVELAYQIPSAWKFSVWNQRGKNFQGKKIWRDAILSYLPPHILNQPKRGWFTPMAKWLRGDLKDYAAGILDTLDERYFNQAAVNKIWHAHLDGSSYNLNIIWAIIMWQLWYNEFIKRAK